jgi:hypothetical protein
MSNDSIVISSRTDIETYVANENPGGVYGHADLMAALVDSIQAADHPAYGRDWSEWLDAHVDGLVGAARDFVKAINASAGDVVCKVGRS